MARRQGRTRHPRAQREAGPGRLITEALIHTVVLPGTLVVAFPWWLLASGSVGTFLRLGQIGLLGIVPIAVGTSLVCWCTWDFIFSGGGTPNPLDPPKSLVVHGAYRYVRNPMYVGVGTALLGEAFVFGSPALVVYTALVMLGFHIFVVFVEEPFLGGEFGPPYVEFCRRVPRWIPRRPAEPGEFADAAPESPRR
jgi:protein-S-isoprenylcysteine O-methyltransferase Ste14